MIIEVTRSLKLSTQCNNTKREIKGLLKQFENHIREKKKILTVIKDYYTKFKVSLLIITNDKKKTNIIKQKKKKKKKN